MKLLLIASFVIVGCATQQEKFVKKYCNYQAASDLAMTHATESIASSVNGFSACADSDRRAAIQGYNDGYAKGKELLQAKNNAKKVIFEIDQK